MVSRDYQVQEVPKETQETPASLDPVAFQDRRVSWERWASLVLLVLKVLLEDQEGQASLDSQAAPGLEGKRGTLVCPVWECQVFKAPRVIQASPDSLVPPGRRAQRAPPVCQDCQGAPG